MPLLRAALTGLLAACAPMTAAISSRGTRIFMGPIWTSKCFVLQFADDPAGAADGLEFDGVSLRDGLTTCGRAFGRPDRLRWCGRRRFGLNCSRNSRRGLAMRRSASLPSFLGGGAILHGVDGLASVVLEVAQEGFELLLHLANFCPLFFAALGSRGGFSRVRLPARGLAGEALGFNLAEIGVEAVEEAGDVLSLGAETAAGVGDDGGVQADLLRDVDSGGGSGNADASIRRWAARVCFVEADGGVEHSGRVGAHRF